MVPKDCITWSETRRIIKERNIVNNNSKNGLQKRMQDNRLKKY